LRTLILSKDLSKKTFLNSIWIALIILLIVFGNQFFIVAKESIKIGFYGNEIIPYILFKIIRDLPLIISFSFSTGLAYSLHKANKDSEKVIFHSNGMSNIGIIKLLSPLILIVFFIVLVLSNILSPWANDQIAINKNRASERPSYVFLYEKQFQIFGKYVFYTDSIENIDEDQFLNNVYLFSKNNAEDSFVFSKKGKKTYDKKNKKIYLDLDTGSIYKIYNNKIENISEFDKYKILIHEAKDIYESTVVPEVEAQNFFKLISLNTNHSLAELFFRISLPVFLLINSIFLIINSESNPRKIKNHYLLYGLVFFVIYFNMILYSKSLIIDGQISALVGFICLHLFVIIFSITLKYLREY